jgi:hypothetical protein
MQRNLRELQRAEKSIEAVLNHLYNVTISYNDRRDYELKSFNRINPHTQYMLDAIDLIGEAMGNSNTLISLMAQEINNPKEEAQS